MAHSLSRRSLLELGAAAGIGSFLPPSLRAAAAAPPPRGGLDAIEPGGLRPLHPGFAPGHPQLASGRQPNAVRPQRLRAAVGRRRRAAVRHPRGGGDKNLQYIGDLPHGWPDGIAARARGWYDGWVPAKSPATMAYYDRRDLPFQYELADTFTICDAYFCSVRSSTSPNRNYLVSGYTGYEPGSAARAVTNAAYDEDRHAGYDWITYPELLEQAGVSWQTYHEWDNFGDNNLEFFASFKAIMAKALAPVDGGRHRNLTSFYGSLPDRPAAEQDRLLAALDASVATLSDAERSLFERGLRRGRPESLAPTFAADVASGDLPAVSRLVTSAADSEHPGASSPIQSAHITYDVLEVLASHRDVWRKTAVFITYDEFDGLFDHVPPRRRPPTSTTSTSRASRSASERACR